MPSKKESLTERWYSYLTAPIPYILFLKNYALLG
nr:MAG TPA: hypothetical protein [Caudoviricetes sp.]